MLNNELLDLLCRKKVPVVGYCGSTIVERSHLARAAPETDKSLPDNVVDPDTFEFSKTPTNKTDEIKIRKLFILLL